MKNYWLSEYNSPDDEEVPEEEPEEKLNDRQIGAYFEIPVLDMERAIDFYQALLDIEFKRGSIDGYDMAFFPYEADGIGISGALAQGDVYKPSINGVFLYLLVEDIDAVLKKAVELGSKILLEKTKAESHFVAEIKDSEGNRICLTTRHQNLKEMDDQKPKDMDDPEERLNDRQKMMYEQYEECVEEYGKFDQTAGANGAHYAPAAKNPFIKEGLICSNCVFFKGGQGCEIVAGKIEPNAICKLWIIPGDLIKK